MLMSTFSKGHFMVIWTVCYGDNIKSLIQIANVHHFNNCPVSRDSSNFNNIQLMTAVSMM